jgi:hypothetical protein
MTVYEQILEVTRRQAAAALADDVEGAIALMDERGRLVAAAPPPSEADHPIIRAILELERDIATSIRRRMLAIREEALASRHGQQALAGYSSRGAGPRVFDLDA